MKNYFYNISGGKPRTLLISTIAAVLDGFAKVFPAMMLIEVFNTIYRYFENPSVDLDTQRLWLISGMVIIWLAVEFLAQSFLYDKTYRVAYEVSASGRLSLAEHIRHLSLGFFGKRDPGDLTNLLLSDYGQVETTISHNVPALISGVILPVIALVGLLFINWRMALAMFIALPIGAFLLVATDALQAKLSKNQVEAKNAAASRLEEYLGGIREIKAHNMGGKRFERLRKSFADLKKESIRLEGMMGPLIMGAMLLVRSGMTIMIFIGSYLLLDGTVTLSVFLLFLIVGMRVYDPLTVVLLNYGEIRYSAFSAQRIMDVKKEPEQGGTKDLPHNQRIQFDQVTFGYDPEKPVIQDLSFTIEPNTITALVGPSGSGKSTVTKLLARFWDIQQGSIKIGGQIIQEVKPEKLLENISMVFQDVYLFQDTIGNNIKIGKETATQAEIEAAAKRAFCHEFIMNLPQGYDTPVGEGGSTLSGGEKQRVSIARALLKDASIILLDEATASLDAENEASVQQAINELVEDKTVILIAHRLKTIQNADQIIVLAEGKLNESGTHEELLQKKGLYEKLWSMQQGTDGWRLN